MSLIYKAIANYLDENLEIDGWTKENLSKHNFFPEIYRVTFDPSPKPFTDIRPRIRVLLYESSNHNEYTVSLKANSFRDHYDTFFRIDISDPNSFNTVLKSMRRRMIRYSNKWLKYRECYG